ncbi:MAG: aspartate--tRNA ligase [Candidatus Krumholzibacteriales bacterium]
MTDPIEFVVKEKWKRTVMCGEVSADMKGRRVVLNGWVKKARKLGNLIFVDLWDRTGLVQIVFDAELPNLKRQAGSLRAEDVIACAGEVRPRPEDMINREMKTGEVEIYCRDMAIYNKSKVPPFNVSDKSRVNEDLRLRYRYLDLRRNSMQENLRLRHRLSMSIRNFLSQQGLLEIETPILVKRTPEGARDYLVPSRTHPGKFYALPQSPQLYKQLLMVSGVDGYFQLARCLRDEDLRRDRQPEHTQVDLEKSFVSEEDVMGLTEGLMARVFSDVLDIELQAPFPRMDYDTAISEYGTDKPDLRFGLEIADCSEIFGSTGFKIFSSVLSAGGAIRGIALEQGYGFSKSRIKKIEKAAVEEGAGGLVWIKVGESVESPVAAHLGEDEIMGLKDKFGISSGLILLVADDPGKASRVLGSLRLELADSLDLVPENVFDFSWVNRFPLFVRSEEGGLEPAHHIFSMPAEEDLRYLDSEPERVRGYLYDLVCNGVELGSGSIRVHRRELQEKLLAVIGIDREEAERKFDFLLESFQYGAPPHGGIAIGVDRLAMVMGGGSSIREYIAFPKTQNAASLMEGSPAEVEKEVLKELNIRTVDPGKE